MTRHERLYEHYLRGDSATQTAEITKIPYDTCAKYYTNFRVAEIRTAADIKEERMCQLKTIEKELFNGRWDLADSYVRFLL